MNRWRNNYGNEGHQPIFNQAALFVERLDALSGLIDECLRVGDLLGAYRLTERLLVRIDYKARTLKETELFGKTYEVYLKDIESKLDRIHNLVMSSADGAKRNAGSVDKDIREVNRLLYWLQWDMHLIMPEQVKIDWRDEVRKDFQ